MPSVWLWLWLCSVYIQYGILLSVAKRRVERALRSVGAVPLPRVRCRVGAAPRRVPGEFYGEAVDMLSSRRERLGGQRLSSSINQMHSRSFGLGRS